MNVIVCVDDGGGMLFNKRRQSRDRVVLNDMLTMVAKTESHLWIRPFSEKLLAKEVSEEMRHLVTVDEEFLDKALAGEFCFVENVPLKPYENRISSVTVYRWNRRYPADTFLDIDLGGWVKEGSVDFAGSSHEKITREVYRK